MGLFDKIQKNIQDKLQNTMQNAIPEKLITSVQKTMQSAVPKGLFGSMQAKAVKDWEDNLTMDGVNDLEKQGVDVTELRQKVAERIAREKVEAATRVYKLDKLGPYKTTPRDPSSEFCKDITAHPPLFGKDKWFAQCTNAPIVYAAVVQAHHGLWTPGEDGSMGAVFVFSPAPSRMYDIDWLKDVASKVSEMKESPSVPADCQKFIKTLRDDQSIFCFRLGASLAGNDEAWCATYAFDDQTVLPHKCLPSDRIVPFLLLDPPEDNVSASLELIPAKYLL